MKISKRTLGYLNLWYYLMGISVMIIHLFFIEVGVSFQLGVSPLDIIMNGILIFLIWPLYLSMIILVFGILIPIYILETYPTRFLVYFSTKFFLVPISLLIVFGVNSITIYAKSQPHIKWNCPGIELFDFGLR